MPKTKKRIVIIDNFDSFTYNLVHLIHEAGCEDVVVLKNNAFDIQDLQPYEYIVLSPGPGLPDEAGLLKDVIRTYGSTKKILGVCLGLQAIGEVYGGYLINLEMVFHGIRSQIQIIDPNDPILKGIASPFEAGRYHSWVIDPEGFPTSMIVTARDYDGQIMAARHRDFQVYGVQFHPESYMTPDGITMMKNFLDL
ncbi:MAG: aminodeoxychorismate/anthranilate synthase component II [Chitinophagales bacterium]|nr:aminodeoxychorismate/anthranilate synthase component II [Chitinophagales bacterium]